jgi:hypothetical protein
VIKPRIRRNGKAFPSIGVFLQIIVRNSNGWIFFFLGLCLNQCGMTSAIKLGDQGGRLSMKAVALLAFPVKPGQGRQTPPSFDVNHYSSDRYNYSPSGSPISQSNQVKVNQGCDFTPSP